MSGGFNIFPREVEDVLSSHPDVAMAAVFGVPHEKWGEAVAALIVARAGCTPSPEALMQLVKDRKGSPHAPKQIEIVDSLPLTRRRQGRQEGAAGQVLGRAGASGRLSAPPPPPLRPRRSPMRLQAEAAEH